MQGNFKVTVCNIVYLSIFFVIARSATTIKVQGFLLLHLQHILFTLFIRLYSHHKIHPTVLIFESSNEPDLNFSVLNMGSVLDNLTVYEIFFHRNCWFNREISVNMF